MAGVSILRSFSQSPVAIRKYLRLYKESLFWLMILEAGKSKSMAPKGPSVALTHVERRKASGRKWKRENMRGRFNL
jgi:hypothetical protein